MHVAPKTYRLKLDIYHGFRFGENFLFGLDWNLPFFLGPETVFLTYLTSFEVLIPNLALLSSTASNGV